MARDLVVRYRGDVSGLKASGAAVKSSLSGAGAAAAAAARVQQRYATAVQAAARASRTAGTAEAAAARKVGIEQLKVQEIRARGKASASQLAAADDRLATAQEKLGRAQDTARTASKQLTDAQDAQVNALRRTETQVGKTGGGFKGLGRLIKTGLREAAGGAFDEFKRRAGRSGQDSGRAFSSALGSGVRSGVGLVVGAVAVLKGLDVARDFVRSSISEARESQQVGAKSTAIIKATGGAARVSANQLGALTTAISNKTGVDDEAIQTGANLLLTFKNVRNEAGEGNRVFNRATAAAVDLSKAGFGSVDSASKTLGKALNDPLKGISALSRAGVTFTEGQKKQIGALVKTGDVLGAQKIILKEVEGQVGGVAAASTTAGEKLKTAFDNAKESVGTAFLPTLDAAETAIRTRLVPGIANLAPLVKSLGPSLGSIGRVASAAFGGFADSIGGGKGAIKSLTDFVSTHQADIVGFFTSAGHAAVAFGKIAAVGVSGVLRAYVGLQKGVQATLEFILSRTQSAFAVVGAGASALGLDDLASKAQGAVGALQTMRDNNQKSDAGAGLAESIADGIDNNLLPALTRADDALTKTGQTEAFKASQRDAAARTAIAIRDVGTAANGSQIHLKRWSDVSKLGADAQGALKSRIKSAQGALSGQIDAQRAAGAGQKALTRTWENGRDKLAGEFRQMGLSRKEAGRLADKYAGIKPKVKTNFSAPGLNDAKAKAERLKAALDNLPRNVRIAVKAVLTGADVAVDAAKKAFGMKTGGVWPGPGRPPIKAARGRVLPGYTPGRDVHKFYSSTGGALELSGGEAVMVPQWTRAIGGPAEVARQNRAAETGQLGQALARGGVPSLPNLPAAPNVTASSARRSDSALSPADVDRLVAALSERQSSTVEVVPDYRGIVNLVRAEISEAARKRPSA